MTDLSIASEHPSPVERAGDASVPGQKAEGLWLPTPLELTRSLPAPVALRDRVSAGRAAVKAVLEGRDRRLLLIAGPCSIHDEKAALDYAARLKALSDEVSDVIFPLMRVYVEKPRTSVGWKGWLNDPDLDGSCRIAEGLRRARELMLRINETGVPVASEALSPFVPRYLEDLVTWMCIGARTVESPVHREMASGLPMPVGFKNSTEGAVEPALHAMAVAARSHSQLSVGPDGRLCLHETAGNPDGHLVLRGGRETENWLPELVLEASSLCRERGLPSRVIVDCAHGNSKKDTARSKHIFESLAAETAKNPSLREALGGLMLESHLVEGAQLSPYDRRVRGLSPVALRYGCSVTDACVGWADTERLVLEATETLRSL